MEHWERLILKNRRKSRITPIHGYPHPSFDEGYHGDGYNAY